MGARTPEFVCFYDWADGRLVRRIDVAAKHVHWSENGELVAIVAEQSFYILRWGAARGAGAAWLCSCMAAAKARATASCQHSSCLPMQPAALAHCC